MYTSRIDNSNEAKHVYTSPNKAWVEDIQGSPPPSWANIDESPQVDHLILHVHTYPSFRDMYGHEAGDSLHVG
jgi:hypothetical protein